jgi:hypothetical protein
MRLLKVIKTDHSENAHDWEVYIHESTVYVKMAAGFGVKKTILESTFISNDSRAISMAKEITKHCEKKAGEIWKKLGWEWWDYMVDHALIKSKATKAPIV